MPRGGKHSTVQARQSSGTAEPPRTPSHTDRARAARAARAREPGQRERGQHLLRGGQGCQDDGCSLFFCTSALSILHSTFAVNHFLFRLTAEGL